MSDFTPPSPKGPPGPPPRVAPGALLADLPLPNPFTASDPDQTPVNRVAAPKEEHHDGLITSARELTPITTAFAVAPKSRPVPPSRIVEPTTPEPASTAPTVPNASPSPLAANPFLVGQAPAQPPRAGSAPQPQAPPGPAVGRPIVGQPGAESPHVPDPHAAFRKGNVLKRLLLVALAAALIGGLFFLIPSGQPETPVAQPSRDPRAHAVIGSSVSPEIIPDPHNQPLEERQKKTAAAEPEAPSAAAARPADNDGFANSFKSSAK